MLILVCANYYVLETKKMEDMTKFSELPEQPSYVFSDVYRLKSLKMGNVYALLSIMEHFDTISICFGKHMVIEF